MHFTHVHFYIYTYNYAGITYQYMNNSELISLVLWLFSTQKGNRLVFLEKKPKPKFPTSAPQLHEWGNYVY